MNTEMRELDIEELKKAAGGEGDVNISHEQAMNLLKGFVQAALEAN